MSSRRQYYINQLNDTIDYLNILKPELKLVPSVIFKHTKEKYISKKHCPNFDTKVYVHNRDVIGVMIDLNKSYPTDLMLVMNLASRTHYGGGYQNGALAQEEELFRKTDYSLHSGKELYPIQKDSFICTPYVTVVKDENYNRLPLKDLFMVDMIAISAINKPKLVNNHLSKEDYEYTQMLIRNTFEFAVHHGYKHLVLGALGCGVFKNPPTDIANIYKQIIKEYNGWFETISFAVLSNRDPNYTIFSSIIKSSGWV